MTKTNFEGKTIKANDYFLIAREEVYDADIVLDNLTVTESNTLRIRNSDGEDADILELGSLSEGVSYQRDGNDWFVGDPTPGTANNASDIDDATESQSADTDTGTDFPANDSHFVEHNISADAFGDSEVIVGADSIFDATALGTTGEALDNPVFRWNMGDGTVKHGKRISHTYSQPGKYLVVLNVSSGKYTASDRIIVYASGANISISGTKNGVDGFIELFNESSKELNISFWHLRVDGLHFTFPENSYILANTKLALPYKATNLLVEPYSEIYLLYPNAGIVAKTSPGALASVLEHADKNTKSVSYSAQNTNTVPEIEVKEEDYIMKFDAPENNNSSEEPIMKSGDILYTSESDESPITIYRWFAVLFVIILFSAGSIIFVGGSGIEPLEGGAKKDERKHAREIARKLEITEEL